jgi:hypothetical protein
MYYLCTFGVRPPDVLIWVVSKPPDMVPKLETAKIVLNGLIIKKPEQFARALIAGRILYGIFSV